MNESEEEAGISQQPPAEPGEGSETQTSEAGGPDPQKVPETAAFTTFLQLVAKRFQADELRKEVRLTSKGFFFAEKHLARVIEIYRDAVELDLGGGVPPSEEKCRKRLFDGQWPRLQYLIDGKHCIAGYLIEFDTRSARVPNIPACQGSFQDPRTSLHIRDPLLFSIDGLDAKVSARGLELSLKSEGESYAISMKAVQDFGEVARRSLHIRRRSPRVMSGLRESLRVLVKLFPKAKALVGKKQILIPGELRNDKAMELRAVGSTVFMVSPERIVSGCFDTAGHNFQNLFFHEIDAIRTARKGPSVIGAVRVYGKRGRSLGTIETEHDTFQIGLEAVQEFLLSAPRSKSLRARFPGRYTVFDGIKEFGKLFKESAWVLEADVPRHIRDQAGEKAVYRRASDWYFIIGNRTQVHACVSGNSHDRHVQQGSKQSQVPRGKRDSKRRRKPRRQQNSREGRQE